MAKIVKLTENDLNKLIQKVLQEAIGEEPVLDGGHDTTTVFFNEGQTSLDSKSTNTIIALTNNFIKSTNTINTLSKYYKTNKIPKFIQISVGTSHTGSPERNAKVAQARLNYLNNLVTKVFENAGINADIIKKFVVNNTNAEYNPSNLDTQFFDKTKVPANPNERIAVVTLIPITIKGLNTAGIQDVQGGINDASGYVTTDEVGIRDAILKLQTYSDIQDLNRALIAQRKGTLEQVLNDQLNNWGDEDIVEVKQIANHLNKCARTSGVQNAVRLYRVPDGYKFSIDLTLK